MAVPNGTTIHTLVNEANARLKAAGKPEINLVVLPTTTETFQQLATGQIEVLGTTTTAASYYIGLRPNDFKPLGEPFGLIGTGIGLRKGNKELFDPMKQSFDSIVADGTYKRLDREVEHAGLGTLMGFDWAFFWSRLTDPGDLYLIALGRTVLMAVLAMAAGA
jgi:polar amino acid transport system substrate-binding protein